MSRTREENEEQVDLEGDNEQEETIGEEVEYEEIEEEEEVEVEEEVEEEVEDEDENENAELVDVQKGSDGDEELNDSETEEEKKKKHAELLALPPHGSEVYIGGIPHDTSKEDLKRFCESIGEVIEVRIMKGKDLGEGNGYAFVTFRSKELASKAIERLNYSEFKGKKIKCSTSQAKNKLFIGNVPRNWGEEVMRRVVNDVGPGVGCIELLKDPMNPGRNRGFVFIEYSNHACAEYSRQKMLKPTFKLDDNAPTVSWADPRNAESSATTQVKSLYVKNLPRDITQDRLKKLFEHHGKITKVVVPPAKAGKEDSRYGFVHFAERSSVMKALKNTEKYEIDGQVLECSLAKPQADQKSSGGSGSQKSTLDSSFPPLGFGLLGGAYGGLGTGFGPAGFGQPLIYGRGPTPAGMAMMPMLLPDGRIGYVLQQPGMQQPETPPPQPRSSRGGASSSSSSGGRRSSSDSNRGRSRYNPY
ncbi:hypothetical protein ERO13_A04G062100v2 [Gossypium hirsutum]|uniref:Heterogeneous nuclear ribonucleoprotein R-like isoform X1 n=2 Tax=Gossypium hirsutum TaxID=3635 RepID=A0A1U8NKQ4_GOSHI|nr:heterogeneous nuclear ribonucleoprotein Q-like isoform X1 [Gossypium hirsutum]XP_016738454.1 heterogeneous nuclear ribonucleoprotein Q-like isoform X1 [Gossypium hirsutum]XP_016738455.1 heterogeneous nuclear ribonucleoprotein Q-like isoform X1 [Gossypium hirsutum]KAG4204813.1 hypothetical protein ERO13_A04G062100v2 [Gossypium hirsutum]KAG4204814.1 hypothetical protein ERO13_A04G062100v2 [Gossypium hirsutum]KAG4204815.1 hypothetical protein ERO13_A04G062100v2 [Gossypium hirsutum]